MFADNDRISQRQLLFQIVLAMVGAFLLFLPGFGELQGFKGILCTILGFLLAAVYSFFLVRIAPSYRRPEHCLGKYGMRLVGACFLVFFILTAAFFVRLITDMIGTYLLTGVPIYVTHGILLLACAMAGTPQVQRRGRMAEACFAVLIGVLVLLLVLSLWQQEWTYLEKDITVTGKELSMGTYEIFAAFTGLGVLPFILGQVKGSSCKSMIGACAILTGILAVILLFLQGSFGTRQVEAREWPVIAWMTGIRIPGGFSARFDPIWIAVFLMLMLFGVGSTLFYGNLVVRRMSLGIPWYWILLAVYLVSVLDFGGLTVDRYVHVLLLYVFAPLLLFINLLMGYLGRRRRV